ncbi:MAG: hypothetical protein HY516_04395 [Candidatus Aenigmarchaeota archaeon]|nr:hypothetical protein [Candidatus Aenigmarchaeota archaeon]
MSRISTTDFVSLLLIFSFLFSHFKPSLVFSETAVSGGDTGSHNYLFDYMRNYLVPNMKLTGWSPDWYLGFPAFQFYFPLPYAIGAALSYFIHPNVAVKVVTLLGTFLLPVTAYFFMRSLRFENPAPAVAAFLSLVFLFIESNSVWGGNIPSTLSGEFSYSLSFSLAFIFVSSLYSSIVKKRYELRNSVVFAAVVLTHVYTAIFAVATSALMLVTGDRSKTRDSLVIMSKTYAISAALMSFWAVPLLFDIGYKTDFGYRWTIDGISSIFPAIYLPIALFSLVAVHIGAGKKDGRVLLLISMMLLALMLYLASQLMGLVDVRFLPFMQFTGVLLAAYGLGELIKKLKPPGMIVLLTGLITILWVNNNVSYIDGWIDWNYAGFESKNSWGQFDALNSFLSGLPYGRIFHEYSPSHSKFGTPRAFESFPMFTGKPVIEGLTIESGLMAPFTFYLQSELSESPTCPIPQLRCSYFDAANGTAHLSLFNVRYVVATSDKLKSALDNSTSYKQLNASGGISVYELAGNNKYAVMPDYEPVAVITKDWRNVSMKWFKDTSFTGVPLVFVDAPDRRFSQTIRDDNFYSARKIALDADCSVSESIRNESLFIKTDCIGKPLLVKVPYFPDWSVEGADKIYLASPGFMLVFPEAAEVKLTYGSTANRAGNSITFAGLVFAASYLSFSGLRKKFQRYGHEKNAGKHGRHV